MDRQSEIPKNQIHLKDRKIMDPAYEKLRALAEDHGLLTSPRVIDALSQMAKHLVSEKGGVVILASENPDLDINDSNETVKRKDAFHKDPKSYLEKASPQKVRMAWNVHYTDKGIEWDQIEVATEKSTARFLVFKGEIERYSSGFTPDEIARSINRAVATPKHIVSKFPVDHDFHYSNRHKSFLSVLGYADEKPGAFPQLIRAIGKPFPLHYFAWPVTKP